MLYINYIIYFIFGTIFGSFATMASYRLPKKIDTIFKPSHCTKCKHKLGTVDLIPVISFLIFKGKCHYCSKKISKRYILIEISMGLLFALNYHLFGLTLLSSIMCLISSVLLIMIVTDLENYIVPLELQYCLIPLVLIYRYLEPGSLYDNYSSMFFTAIFGFSLGLFLQYGALKILKKDGLGGADVIFLAIAGGFLGLERFAIFLFLSGLMGVITHFIWTKIRKVEIFPFIPALAISLYLCLIFEVEVFVKVLSA